MGSDRAVFSFLVLSLLLLFFASCKPADHGSPDASGIGGSQANPVLNETADHSQVPASCPASCDDGDVCTLDGCSAGTRFSCQHIPQPCCGDGQCQRDENECTCAKDCGACNVTGPGLRYECQESRCVLVRVNGTNETVDCSDHDRCTTDSLYAGECLHTPRVPCCGNNACEAGESCGSCYQDCACTGDDFTLGEFPGFFMTTPLIITGDEAPAEDQLSATIIALAAPGTAQLASEVDSVQGRDAVVVGSPCLNPVAFELMGNPSPCDRDVSQSVATIMTVRTGHDSVALLVSSLDSSLTRLAAGVVRDHARYASSLAGCTKVGVRRGVQGEAVVNREACEQ